MARRILKDLKIDRIAAVDRPTQEHAIATIMKRRSDDMDMTAGEKFAKVSELAHAALREGVSHHDIAKALSDFDFYAKHETVRLEAARPGFNDAIVKKADAELALAALAKAEHAKSGGTYAAAYVRALDTPAGRALYPSTIVPTVV